MLVTGILYTRNLLNIPIYLPLLSINHAYTPVLSRPDDISPNLNKMIDLGYTSDNCQVTRKREIENYIPSSYFSSLQDPITINYSDWDDVKDICKRHAETIRLGGKKVCDKHFTNLSYSQLRSTLCPTDDNNDDEFLEIYGKLKQMII